MSKAKICCGLLLCALLIPVRVRADIFGADVAVLGQILAQSVKQVAQGLKMIREGQMAYEQVQQAAAFVRSPGVWKQIVVNAAQATGSALGKPSTGSDLAAIAQLAEGRRTALEAMRQIASDPRYQPTAENTAQVSLLHLQAINATREMNELQATLNYQAQVKQYQAQDEGLAGAVEDMTQWHLQQ